MISRYRISIDNVQLDSVDNSILITNIQYPKPVINPTLERPGDRDGDIVSRFSKRVAIVTVTFCINKYGIADRHEVYQKVIKWANSGHVLRTNDRENIRLSHAIVDEYPELNVRDWTREMSITFADHVFPYWEDDTATSLTLSMDDDKSGSITIDGSAAKTYITAAITANTDITWIRIRTSLSDVYLTGLTLDNNDVVNIDYDDDMNLRIRKGSTSLLNKRSADSSDELLIPIGTSTIRVSASNNVTSVIQARGCWN